MGAIAQNSAPMRPVKASTVAPCTSPRPIDVLVAVDGAGVEPKFTTTTRFQSAAATSNSPMLTNHVDHSLRGSPAYTKSAKNT
jgi:hypothetical protein